MKISKEVQKPVPPPCEYYLVLNEEEYQVLKATLAVGRFADIRNYLEKSCPIIINRPDDILYNMHNEIDGWSRSNV